MERKSLISSVALFCSQNGHFSCSRASKQARREVAQYTKWQESTTQRNSCPGTVVCDSCFLLIPLLICVASTIRKIELQANRMYIACIFIATRGCCLQKATKRMLHKKTDTHSGSVSHLFLLLLSRCRRLAFAKDETLAQHSWKDKPLDPELDGSDSGNEPISPDTHSVMHIFNQRIHQSQQQSPDALQLLCIRSFPEKTGGHTANYRQVTGGSELQKIQINCARFADGAAVPALCVSTLRPGLSLQWQVQP
eukprot:gene6417-289_t